MLLNNIKIQRETGEIADLHSSETICSPVSPVDLLLSWFLISQGQINNILSLFIKEKPPTHKHNHEHRNKGIFESCNYRNVSD